MTAVGFGQQGSQAVGSGFESLPCQNFFTIYPSHLSIPEISETLRGSPTKIFGTVRQKILTENRDTPSPVLSINFFDTGNFVKHRRVPLQSFSVL